MRVSLKAGKIRFGLLGSFCYKLPLQYLNDGGNLSMRPAPITILLPRKYMENNMKLAIIAMVLFAPRIAACADWYGQLHIAAIHPQQYKYELFTPGLGIVREGEKYVVSAGAYSNSHGEPSGYLSAGKKVKGARLQAGLVSGYDTLYPVTIWVSAQWSFGSKVVTLLPGAAAFGLERRI
jgi:hypothetical protein